MATSGISAKRLDAKLQWLGSFPQVKVFALEIIFSVTRRSRSDSRQLLTYLLSPLLSVSTDLTDVTLVSDDTY